MLHECLLLLLLLIFREREKRRGIERNIIDQLPPAHPLPEIKPDTQTCTLTGNWISNLLVHGFMLNQWATPARQIFSFPSCLITLTLAFWTAAGVKIILMLWSYPSLVCNSCKISCSFCIMILMLFNGFTQRLYSSKCGSKNDSPAFFY